MTLLFNMKNMKQSLQYHKQGEMYEKALKYVNMGFTGMFSVETVLKIIGFGVKVGFSLNKSVHSLRKWKRINWFCFSIFRA